MVDVDVGLCETNDNLFGVVGEEDWREWPFTDECEVEDELTVGVNVKGFNTWKIIIFIINFQIQMYIYTVLSVFFHTKL
jgi:hypothetical protein